MSRVMRFKAAERPATFRVGGRVFAVTENGALRPLIDDTALHLNPDFENDTAGVPDDWNDAFQIGGTVGVDTTDFVFGTQSGVAETAAGGGNLQHWLGTPFDVAPGDIVPLGAWAKRTLGDPTMKIGIRTRASGTPLTIDPPDVTTSQETEKLTLTDDWTLYSKQFQVPAGHFRAAMWVEFAPTAAEATRSLVDGTTSARSGTGSVASIQQAVLSAPITPNGIEGGTGLTLTDLEVDVDNPNESAVYEVRIESEVQFTGAQINLIELLVDGVADPRELRTRAAASGYWLGNSQTWIVTGLSVGSHTFSARTRNSAAGTNATVGDQFTTMTVRRVS